MVSTRSGSAALSENTVSGAPIAAGNRRKSLRLQKTTPPSLAATKGNSVKNKKKKGKRTTVAAMTGPLRRSERRSKKLSSSSPSSSLSATSIPSKNSDSKSPGSSSLSSSSSGSKSKCVKPLGVEDKEVGEEEERDVGTSKVDNRKMDARVYRAVFEKTEQDCCEESGKVDKSTQEGGNTGREEMLKDGVLSSEDAKAQETTVDSKLSGNGKELLEHNVNLGSLVPSNATEHEANSAPERNQSDCCGEEASQMLVSTNSMTTESGLIGPVKELSENNATLSSSVPSNATTHESSGAPESGQSDCHRDESRNPVLNENFIRNCSGHDKGEKLIPSKRKGTMMDMHSDVSATLVGNGNCNVIADADPSRLCDNTAGTNGSCSKRIRRICLSDVQSDQRKLTNNVNQLTSKVEGLKLSTGNEEERPQGNSVEYIRKQQRSLHHLLKPEIAKLCRVLLLPDNVKNMVDSCLQYVMYNRQICTEPASLLQDFQLSLCWIASSLLNHNLDFEASIELAERHLNFKCKKAMVDAIYSKLLELKEEILVHTGKPNVTDPRTCTEVAPEVESDNKDISKRQLLLVQQEEKHKLTAVLEKQMADVRARSKVEWAAIRHCSPNDTIRREKFMDLYGKKLGELKRQHEIRFKDLEAKQREAMWNFKDSRGLGELLNQGPSNCYQAQTPNGPKNAALVSCHVADGKSSNNKVEAMTRDGSGVGLSKSAEINSHVVVVCGSPVELQTPPVKHADANEMEIIASEDEGEGCENFSCESRNDENAAQIHEADGSNDPNNAETPNLPLSDERIAPSNFKSPQEHVHSPNTTCLQNTDNSAQIYEPGDGNGSNNHVTMNSTLADERIADGAMVSDREVRVEMPGTGCISHCPENVAAMNPPSPMQQISGGAINVSVLDEELSRTCGAASPSNVPHANAVPHVPPPLNPPSITSDQQEGVQKTLEENTSLQEALVSRPAQSPPDPDTARETHNSLVSGPVDIEPADRSNHASVIVEPPEQVQPLPCAESLPSNQDLSNILSATEVQHQQTNGDTLSGHIPEAATEVLNEAVEQLASNSGLDSRSHQVVHPASNLDLDSPMPSGVRRQSLDPRNLSTTLEISNRPIQTAAQSGYRIVPPVSRDPLINEMEIIRRIAEHNRKNHENTMLQLQSDYEKEKEELRRKYEVTFHNKEVDFQQQNKELDTRYKTVLLNKTLAEAWRYICTDHRASGMQQASKKSYPTTSSQTVGPPHARAYTTASSQTVAPPHARPFTTASSQAVAPPPGRPYTTASSQTVAPPHARPYTTASLQTMAPPSARPYTTASSQTVALPPTRPAYNTSGISSRVSHANSLPPSVGNFQAGGEIRSPAPHLQGYRPPMSVPASSQPAPSNIPEARTSFSNLRLSLIPNQSDPNKGPCPASTGGLPTPNLSAMDVCMDANGQSGMNPPNAPQRVSDLVAMPRFCTGSSRPPANSTHQATSDVVCLSDDDDD